MNKMLQVRNLKAEIHKKAKVRSAEEGLTLSEWAARLIEREVSRPSNSEIAARMRTLPALKLKPSTADLIREERDAR